MTKEEEENYRWLDRMERANIEARELANERELKKQKAEKNTLLVQNISLWVIVLCVVALVIVTWIVNIVFGLISTLVVAGLVFGATFD